MDRFFQVFVSSTFDDLKNERSQVSDALAKAGYVAAGMELFPASNQQQLEYIKRIIDRSDYYVVIVGGRYGSLADNGLSYTENEFEYARSNNIPVLAFLHSNPGSIALDKSEANSNKRDKLKKFKRKLAEKRLVQHWTDLQDLCLKVVTSVAQEVNLNPRPGWIRGDQAVDPKVLQEMERLRIENSELRQKLATTDSTSLQFDPRFLGPEDIIEVDYEVIVPREMHADADPDDQLGPTPEVTRSYTFVIKLKHLFVAAYETLHLLPTEDSVFDGLAEALAMREGNAVSFAAYQLTRKTGEVLRRQLEALDLVEIVNKDGKRCWRATEKGRRFALANLALPKPTDSKRTSLKGSTP